MSTINLQKCNEEQLWEYVAVHLEKNGLDVVLVGGAVSSIYTQGQYPSGDLDFVIRSVFKEKLPKLLAKIGFLPSKGRGTLGRYYINPECPHLFLEFPSGPVSIGEDSNIVPAERTVDGVTIKLFSPTDCVKDRLASYIYHDNSGQYHGERKTLEQAATVAFRHPINLNEIERWCKVERKEEIFQEFIQEVEKLKTRAQR